VEFSFENWLKQGAIIGKVGKWVETHWGEPLFFKTEAELEGPAFYKNNFFLSQAKPWMSFPHSRRWEWKDWQQLQRQTTKSLGPAAHKKLKWEEPDKKNFEKVFKQIKKEITAKNILKAVPVVSSRAEKTVEPEGPLHLALQQAPKNTYLHGAWSKGEGFLGFTPEILFLSEKDKKIKTMALAGTRSKEIFAQDPEDFLRDPKEQKEHQLVVQDILQQLTTLGKAKSGKTGLLELNYLVHLYTPLQVTSEKNTGFEELVKLLHPTPALGVFPRTQFSLLKDWREGSDFLGAPFGIRWSDINYICLVAIRNLRWDQTHYYIDNGCGVVEESQLDEEWRELKSKRESVKKVFKV
jgi:menaquinone-specific isochorismate synthase